MIWFTFQINIECSDEVNSGGGGSNFSLGDDGDGFNSSKNVGGGCAHDNSKARSVDGYIHVIKMMKGRRFRGGGRIHVK